MDERAYGRVAVKGWVVERLEVTAMSPGNFRALFNLGPATGRLVYVIRLIRIGSLGDMGRVKCGNF